MFEILIFEVSSITFSCLFKKHLLINYNIQILSYILEPATEINSLYVINIILSLYFILIIYTRINYCGLISLYLPCYNKIFKLIYIFYISFPNYRWIISFCTGPHTFFDRSKLNPFKNWVCLSLYHYMIYLYILNYLYHKHNNLLMNSKHLFTTMNLI